MNVGELFATFGYKMDKSSERKVMNGVKSIRSAALKLLGAIGIGFSLKAFVEIGDQFNQLRTRVDGINDGLQSTDDLMEQIKKSALETRSGFAETAEFVATLGSAAKDAFGGTAEVIDFATLLNKTLITGGSSAQAAAGAVRQLTQGLWIGTLRGDELNSVLENAPMLIDKIAAELKVPRGQIRALAAEGKITAEVVKNSLLNASGDINAQFAKMPVTFAQAMTTGKTVLTDFLQKLNTMLGFSKTLGTSLNQLFLSLDVAAKNVLTRIQALIDRNAKKIQAVKDKLAEWKEKLINIADALGGVERIMRIVGIALALAFAPSIIGGFVKALAILAKTPAIAALLILAALVEDFVYFMQGKNSLIGEVLGKWGYDADDVRKKIFIALDNMKTTLKNFLEFVWKHKEAIVKAVAAIGAAFGAWKIAGAVGKVIGVLKKLAIITRLQAIASTVAAVAQRIFNTAMKANPLAKVAALVGLLVTAFVALYKKNEGFRTAVNKLWGAVKPIFTDFAQKLMPKLIEIWEKLKPVIDRVIDSAMEMAQAVLPILLELITAILPVLVTFTTAVLPIILTLITAILPLIMQIVTAVLPVILELISALLPIFTNIVTSILPVVLKLIEAVLPIATLIVTVVGELAKSVLPIVVSLLDAIIPILSTVLSALKPIFDVIGGIIGAIGKVVGWVGKGLTWVVDLVTGKKSVPTEVDAPLPETAATPGFATGTNRTPDTFIAGENGAELITGAAGRKVFTAAATRDIFATLNAIMGGAAVRPATLSNVTNRTSNRTVTQNLLFQNTFNGDRAGQQKSAAAMDTARGDITAELYRALAYA